MFRTQSPTNIKDLLVPQVRETVKALKGKRQNWKQEANLNSQTSGIWRRGKAERMVAAHILVAPPLPALFSPALDSEVPMPTPFSCTQD